MYTCESTKYQLEVGLVYVVLFLYTMSSRGQSSKSNQQSKNKHDHKSIAKHDSISQQLKSS